MSMTDNDRAVLGGNNPPDFAKLEQERLADEYRGYTNTLAELTKEAEERDVPIPDDDNADEEAVKNGALIKRFRDLDARIEETRKVEKEPYLRRGNACDAFFTGLRRMIQGQTPQERRTQPGWIDRLQAHISAHQNRKEARERARLQAESQERERLANEARRNAEREAREAAKLRQQAEDEAADAARARNPERIEEKTLQAAQTSEFAGAKEVRATEAAVRAEQASDAATDARISTLAKPADIVRVRGVTQQGAGVTLTQQKEKFAIVVDRDLLDYAKLAPYFSDDAIQVAVNKFARATSHREQMAGAEIGERNKNVVR